MQSSQPFKTLLFGGQHLREPAIAKHCTFIFVLLALGGVRLAKAQDNYEVQVYGSDTVASKTDAGTAQQLHRGGQSSGARDSRFSERLILTCGRTLAFRRQTDIGRTRAPCGIWLLRKTSTAAVILPWGLKRFRQT